MDTLSVYSKIITIHNAYIFCLPIFRMNDTLSIASEMNDTNYVEEGESDIEIGWGSSSYSDNLNSTMNMTNEEFLRLYLGPNQVCYIKEFFKGMEYFLY